MKNKFLKFVFALCFMFPCMVFLTACGEDPDDDKNNNPPPPSTYEITINYTGFSSSWMDMHGINTTAYTMDGTYLCYLHFPQFVEVDNLQITVGDTPVTFSVSTDSGSTFMSLSDFIASNYNYDNDFADIDVKCEITNITSDIIVDIDISNCTKVNRVLLAESFGLNDSEDYFYYGVEVQAAYYCGAYQENVDFVVSYSNNNGPGLATLTITGINDYANSEPLTFNYPIYQYLSSDDFELVCDNEERVFGLDTVNENNNKASVTCLNSSLQEGVHYRVAYSQSESFTFAGTKHVYVEAMPGSYYKNGIYGENSDIYFEYYLCNVLDESYFSNVEELKADEVWEYGYAPQKTPQFVDLEMIEGLHYSTNSLTDGALGGYTFTVTGNCRPSYGIYFTGSVDFPFEIVKIPISLENPTIDKTVLDLDQVRADTTLWPDIIFYDAVYGTNYGIKEGGRPTSNHIIQVGHYSITFECFGNYSGEATFEFDITQDIEKAFSTNKVIPNQEYTGEIVNIDNTIQLRLLSDYSSLTKDTDYTVNYSSTGQNRGDIVTVTVSGTYDYNKTPNSDIVNTTFYTGDFTYNYHVVDRTLVKSDFNLDPAFGWDNTYTGLAICPEVYSCLDGQNYSISENFDVKYECNVYVNGFNGVETDADYQAKVIITPKAILTGGEYPKYEPETKLVIPFNIVPKGIWWSHLRGEYADDQTNTEFVDATWGGEYVKQDVVEVRDTYGSEWLDSKFYEVTYTNLDKEPTSISDPTIVTVTITGKHCLTGTKSFTYKVFPKEVDDTDKVVTRPTSIEGLVYNGELQQIVNYSTAIDAPYYVQPSLEYSVRRVPGGTWPVKFVLTDESYSWETPQGETEVTGLELIVETTIAKATDNEWLSVWPNNNPEDMSTGGNEFDIWTGESSQLKSKYGEVSYKFVQKTAGNGAEIVEEELTLAQVREFYNECVTAGKFDNLKMYVTAYVLGVSDSYNELQPLPERFVTLVSSQPV